MHGRLEAVVGQAHEVVADIDDEGARDGRGLDPLAVAVEHLQAALHVLPQQGEALQVGVGAEADVGRVGGLRGRHGRVEVEDAVGARVRGHAVEVRLWQVEREREDAHQTPRQAQARLPIGDACCLEAGEVRRPFPYEVFAADVRLHFCRYC